MAAAVDMPQVLREVTRQVDRPAYVARSWHIVRQSIRQLDPYQLVITDRFHGHILCAIRQIPHVVVGNNHHKIQGHWEQWMRGLSGATFARSPEELTAALATAAAVPLTPASK
jgi:pyruvyl transferase EpsO